MKKLFNIFLAVLATAAIMSCEKENYGTMPGTDTNASVRVYTSSPSLPYDADSDVCIRLASNASAKEVYLFIEKASEKEARNLVEEAYADYVVANGTKVTPSLLEFDGSSIYETIVEGLKGDNVISAVAVNAAGEKSLSSTSFFGIEWEDVVAGTYYFKATSALITRNIPGAKVPTVLQQRKDQPTSYRFRNVFGAGMHLVINTINQFGEDEDGVYQFFRVPAQQPGMTDASYGAIGVRDVGYWQNDDSFITDGGYECGMYEDYSCFIMMQWFVSAGNLGYNWYDFFVPEE